MEWTWRSVPRGPAVHVPYNRYRPHNRKSFAEFQSLWENGGGGELAVFGCQLYRKAAIPIALPDFMRELPPPKPVTESHIRSVWNTFACLPRIG
jgi:hypothetical protein